LWREKAACAPRAAAIGSLMEEILERAQWEERMGDFLLEPLVPRVELDHPFTAGQLVSVTFTCGMEMPKARWTPKGGDFPVDK